MIQKIIVKGEPQYAVIGILGEDATHMYAEVEGNITKKDAKEIKSRGEEIFRFFDTLQEAEAFVSGLCTAIGSFEFMLTNYDDHEKIFGNLSKLGARFISECE
jgi:hypothetical protein